MEEEILKTIYNAGLITNNISQCHELASKEIADKFERFTGWLLRRRGERIGLITEEYATIHEAYNYWLLNIEGK